MAKIKKVQKNKIVKRTNINWANMLRKLLFVFFIILVIAVIATAGAFYWYQSKLNYRKASDEKFFFQIKPNEGTDNIITTLIGKGFVSEKYVWQIYMKLNPTLGINMQAGDFELNTNMSIPDVIQALQKANIKKGVRITILEGLRYDEIATILEKGFAGTAHNNFSATEFLKVVENPSIVDFSKEVNDFLAQNKPAGKGLEGFLFPDTYFFEEGTNAVKVIEKLVTILKQKLSETDYQQIYGSNYSYYEYLTVASLIERETLTVAERPIVADIIYKRLEKGVDGVKMLQFCSTMLYIIKDWTADEKINESLKDQYKTNPYNTYRVAGLPPTPICNPGLVSLKAAIYPEKNDYYFFIHDSNGVIHYGRNLSEHNANIKKYL